jgi:hypothetical protein
VSEPVSSPPLRTWRPMAAWTAAILLALGLAWFVGAVVVPVWQVRRVLPNFPGAPDATWDDVVYKGYMYAPQLGPPESAAHKLSTYIRAPNFVAPRKNLAMHLLRFCREDGRRRIELFRKDSNPELRVLALQALRMFKDVDATVVGMENLSDPAPAVRIEAVGLLKSSLWNRKADDATPAAVIDVLASVAQRDPDPNVRSAAAEARKKIRGEEKPQ